MGRIRIFLMKAFFFLPLSVFSVCALPACDQGPQVGVEEGEAPLFEESVAQLEEERRDLAAVRDEAFDRELAEARRQLQIALAALEEQALEGEDEDPGDDTGSIDAAEAGVEDVAEDEDPAVVPGAAKAIVVEEHLPVSGNEVALQNAVPVALLDAGDHQIFFVELSRFGEWFETAEYGYVWQPADLRTDPAWRPYTLGRWVHSDQGWTWLSDEPFGWAVYHYGRWVLLADHGWIWVPGDDWAPAWVSWRQNDDYLGWAPLPPETLYDDIYEYDPGIDLAYDVAPDYYNFVPVDYFYEPVRPYCVPRVRVTTIIINTRNVTRFSMHERRVHCGGPDFAWVNRQCRRPARPCRLHFGTRHEHFAHRHRHRLHDDSLHVFAPRVNAPWNAAVCPGRVAGNLGRVDVVRAGKGQVKRDLVVRHQRAALRRHEAAREAVATAECQVALRQNLRRQRAEREGLLAERSLDERQRRRAEAENGLRAASAAVAAAERRVNEGQLDPRKRAEAKQSIQKVQRELAQAREALDARMPGRAGLSAKAQAVKPRPLEQGPRVSEKPGRTGVDLLGPARVAGPDKGQVEVADALSARQRAVAQRAAQQAEERRQMAGKKAAGEAREGKENEQRERLAMEKEQVAEVGDQRVLEAKRQAAEGVVRGGQAEKKEKELRHRETPQPKADKQALAQRKVEEAKRRALAKQQEEADERKREALIREKAEEAKRQALAQRKAEESRRELAAQKKAAEARQQELAREKMEEARQRALAQQKAEESRRELAAQKKAAEARQQELAREKMEEAKRRALAKQQEEADEKKRQVLIREKAEEAERQALAQRKAEESRRELAAQKKAAEARQQALAREKMEEARQRALAQQKAEESRRELMARQKAAEARQQAAAQQKAEEARRQALLRQRAEEAKRRALAQQRAEEAKKRALAQQKAEETKQRLIQQQKAADARKRAEYESRRRAQAEAQRRAAAEQAKVRAEMQRRAESEARRRAAAEQARRQAQLARAAAESKARAASKAKAEAIRRQAEAVKQRSTKRR